jgi:hypothetical protein
MPSIELLLPRLSDPYDEVCVRFQQLTGAVMAKGVEDTAFYRYTRFIGLNEVGADPGQFGLDVPAFHAVTARRQEVAPWGMTTLSTHDTKRGEDLRARLAVLAELPTSGPTRRGSFTNSPRSPTGLRLPALAVLRGHRTDRAGARACLRREGDARGL